VEVGSQDADTSRHIRWRAGAEGTGSLVDSGGQSVSPGCSDKAADLLARNSFVSDAGKRGERAVREHPVDGCAAYAEGVGGLRDRVGQALDGGARWDCGGIRMRIHGCWRRLVEWLAAGGERRRNGVRAVSAGRAHRRVNRSRDPPKSPHSRSLRDDAGKARGALGALVAEIMVDS
jgi:hypothetical protein